MFFESFFFVIAWLLYAVGKPVFHKSVNEIYGCWLRDPATSADIDHEKTYVTEENDTHNLYEYPTKMKYRMNWSPRRKYNIPEGFQVSLLGILTVIDLRNFHFERRKPKNDYIMRARYIIQLFYVVVGE